MSKTLEQILGFENLVGIIQNPQGGVPNLFPPAFMAASGRPIVGKTATWVEVKGNRQTARLVQYGAPSVRRGLKGLADRSAIMLHTHEHIRHDASVLMQLRNMDNPTAQRMGQQYVAYETAEFRRYFQNLRVAALCSMLTLGAIYFDGDGNLLPTSSGAVTTVDFSVPSGNKTQLNMLGTGSIISASWATATTDISGQITSIKNAFAQLNGYVPMHVFCGANIRGYLAGNNTVKELMKTDTSVASAFRNNQIAAGLFGMTWHDMSGAFFEDSAGTNQSWWGADMIVITPDPTPDWFEFLEGTYPVPTALGGISSDGASALAGVTEVKGMFSYAKVEDDPVSIKHNAGDTFLPTLKVPGAIAIGDVTP